MSERKRYILYDLTIWSNGKKKKKKKTPSIWSYRTDCCLSQDVEIEQTWMNIVKKVQISVIK